MMRPDKIDLFDLSDKILERLNDGGKYKLTHYDFDLKFSRDINFPSGKFNIYLILFKQELPVTYYTIDYNTIDKIVNLLFVHLRDDYGYDTIESIVVYSKKSYLQNNLKDTIEELYSILKLNNTEPVLVDIDEQYDNSRIDEKGLPIFELNIFSEAHKIDIKIELNEVYYMSNDKKENYRTCKIEIKHSLSYS